MFYLFKRIALKRRKKAIDAGIPDRFLALGDCLLNKALLLRERAGKGIPKNKSHHYDRALNMLGAANDVFTAQCCDHFMKCPNSHLEKELQKRKAGAE